MDEANKDGVADILLSMRYNPKITSPNLEISGSEQLDLNLGLSLGGCYSQILEEKPLIRTSSLNRDLTLNENYEGGRFLSLERSSSLPTTMGAQELRKVKEMQAMKRMEAKKRLLKKHRHRRGSSSEEEKLPAEAKLSNWAIESSRKNTAYFCAIEKIKSNVRPSANLRIQAKVPTISQPTVTSRAMENGKSVYAANYCSEPVVNSGTMENRQSTDPANYHSARVITLEEMQNGKRVNPDDGDAFEPAESEQERPSKKLKVLDNGVHGMTAMEMMKLMPTVTATGDGPNGTTIEGFLYKYKKGQVTIVCICHGRFLSPAEFVEHAGRSDVENPMKHINVLPATL